jgi:hypothetical protein
VTVSVVQQAIAMLATQLAVDPARIDVLRSEEVTWRDGSIGCPQPGHMYTQAMVPGSLVELAYDGKTYMFHQSGRQPPFYCANPSPPAPS